MPNSSPVSGAQIAGAAGGVLFIALFLPWYSAEVSVGQLSQSASASAWEALSLVDIVLFLAALVAMGVALGYATGSLGPELGRPAALAVVGAGGLAVLLVLFRLVDIPAGDASGVEFGRKIGGFVALVAALGIAGGGAKQLGTEPAGPRTSPQMVPPTR